MTVNADAPRLGALKLVLPFMRPYRWPIAGASAALLVSGGLVLALGQGVRRLIDSGFAAGDAGRLDAAAAAMFAVVAALAISTTCRFYLVSWLGERVSADLRKSVFARVIGLSPSFFETARTGDILSRLSTDTSLLQSLVGSSISMWLRGAVMLVGAMVMLVLTSPMLALFVVGVVPLVVGPLVIFGRRERKLSRAAQDRVADLGAYAEEAFSGVRTVQANTHEATDIRLFDARVEQSVATALARVRTRSWLILAVILLGFGAITLSVWFGGRQVVAGNLSGGQLSAFVFYAVLVATSLSGLSELWGEMQRAAGAADRIAELMSARSEVVVPPHPVRMPSPSHGLVSFEDVTFRYAARPDAPALHAVSFAVEPGETVAIVGPSGAGKSTIFQLLLRFYDPQSGRIRIDNVDIASADPLDVRGRIGVVPQDPVIFSADAWHNVRYGRPEASDDEVRAAIRAASADFLDELPEGLGTFLGEKGVRLSGGQRQRVAIARAILRDPAILLLDEATSALDAESERAVQQALTVLSAGRTTLVIAHRLATVRRADRILVVDAGRVIATGPHEQLVRENGLYARLAELQFAAA